MDLGKKIMTMRNEKNLSQEQLAEKLNVTRQTISNWENGSKIPSAETLDRLSEILNVSIDYLLGRSKENYLDVTGIQEDQVLILSALVDSLKGKQ